MAIDQNRNIKLTILSNFYEFYKGCISPIKRPIYVSVFTEGKILEGIVSFLVFFISFVN